MGKGKVMRGHTISYASAKKRARETQQQQLLDQIKQLEDTKLKEKQNELDKL